MAPRSPAHISGIPAWALRTAVLFALALGGYLLFELGRIQGGYSVLAAAEETRERREEIAALEAEVVALKEEIALQQTHRQVEREAYDQVETNLVDLQQKIQEQRDAIEFYRGIMSPEDGGRGLRVQALKVSRGPREREYVLRLVLVQVMKHDRAVKGTVDVSVDGAVDGETRSYPLSELLVAGADADWPFQFRYFQTFDRALVLPDGFVPETLHVRIESDSRSVESVEQSFAWHTVQS